MKTKGLNEAHFLSLLQRALSRTTPDAQLATTIYAEVEREVRLTKDLESLEKFCEKGALPNLAPETVADTGPGEEWIFDAARLRRETIVLVRLCSQIRKIFHEAARGN
jgi:hypothetical protein